MARPSAMRMKWSDIRNKFIAGRMAGEGGETVDQFLQRVIDKPSHGPFNYIKKVIVGVGIAGALLVGTSFVYTGVTGRSLEQAILGYRHETNQKIEQVEKNLEKKLEQDPADPYLKQSEVQREAQKVVTSTSATPEKVDLRAYPMETSSATETGNRTAPESYPYASSPWSDQPKPAEQPQRKPQQPQRLNMQTKTTTQKTIQTVAGVPEYFSPTVARSTIAWDDAYESKDPLQVIKEYKDKNATIYYAGKLVSLQNLHEILGKEFSDASTININNIPDKNSFRAYKDPLYGFVNSQTCTKFITETTYNNTTQTYRLSETAVRIAETGKIVRQTIRKGN